MSEKMHFGIIKDKEWRYLCNQACGVAKEKIANDYYEVTCKNCKRILNKDKMPKEVEVWMKKMKKSLKERGIPICPSCSKDMFEIEDEMTGKKTGHLWKCDCVSWEGKCLMMGGKGECFGDLNG